MSIIRIGKRARYTVIDNRVVDDPNLDYDGLGLLVYLLSKPDNWDVSVMHLAKQKKSGKSKIERLLQDLQRSGYASWKRLSSGKTEWTIYEHPQPEKQVKEKPQPEKPDQEKPDLENQAQVKTEVKTKTEPKQTKKKKKEIDWSKVEQPENLNMDAWAEWADYKKAINDFYGTHQGINKSMNDLAKLPQKNQKQCIDEAIGREWRGFFTKNHQPKPSHNQPPISQREFGESRVNF